MEFELPSTKSFRGFRCPRDTVLADEETLLFKGVVKAIALQQQIPDDPHHPSMHLAREGIDNSWRGLDFAITAVYCGAIASLLSLLRYSPRPDTQPTLYPKYLVDRPITMEELDLRQKGTHCL